MSRIDERLTRLDRRIADIERRLAEATCDKASGKSDFADDMIRELLAETLHAFVQERSAVTEADVASGHKPAGRPYGEFDA